MLTPNFTDPQFVDANGVGGLNAAFLSVSSSLSSAGSGMWSGPGLVNPENSGTGIAGLVATVNIPPPWGLITSGGTFVQAHGAQTGQDTTSYPVNFASVVPATGSVTAYCVATPIQIQQNPFPIPGPPPGHPSYNPDFVPTVGYATTVDSVALSASTTPPNNVTSFEIFRTTLSAGQSTLSGLNTAGWSRAAVYRSWPSAAANTAGGLLTPAQAQVVLSPTAGGLTSTLPSLSTAGGLVYIFSNTSAGNWTIATVSAPDVISGFKAGTQNSVVLPPGGAIILQGRSSGSTWSIVGASPNVLLAQANTWTADQTVPNIIIGHNDALYGTNSGGSPSRLFGLDSADNTFLLIGPGGLCRVFNAAGTDIVVTIDNSGNIIVPNNAAFYGLDTGGTARQMLTYGTDNNVYSKVGVGGHWRIFNAAASGSVADVDNNGNASFTGVVTWIVPKLNQITFTGSSTFNVPAGVDAIEVEVWGAGAGSAAGTGTLASSGGGGGGYARRLITGLTPGSAWAVTVGVGGSPGVTGTSLPTAGGTSSFGPFVAATGGTPNAGLTLSDPTFTSPPGIGSGGDINMAGAWSFAPASMINGTGFAGGNGGAAAAGGGGGSGNVGSGANGGFPGGGAGGVGASTGGGQAGAHGCVKVRW